LDAKSSLAVEYINYAQSKVNDYLVCASTSIKQKQENYEAGLRLEKAINIISEDDPEFAKSLMSRMYFLKASGDFGEKGKDGSLSTAFENAYSTLAIDPKGAYINNRLALLHLENNRTDSAFFYAEKATNLAPKWVCALNTLSLIRRSTNSKPEEQKKEIKKNSPLRKNSIGFVTGSGVSQLNPTFARNPQIPVTSINPKNIAKFDIGIFYQVGISNTISIRPSTLVTFEGGNLIYENRPATGGPVTTQTVSLKNVAANISLPVIIRFSQKNIAPYFSLGPSFSYIFKQDATSTELVPVKKSVVLGDAGFGVDISFVKSRLILSPELKFSTGLTEMKGDANTIYATTLSSLKKQTITFSVYLRGR
jgi:tetratricopeptide (TPR) repeat protein